MGPHPGSKKLVVRSFERKPTSYRLKPKAAPSDPPPAPKPASAPPKVRPPGPAAGLKLVPLARQRKRKRARLAALAWLKQAFPDLFGHPPKLAVGLGKEISTRAVAAGLKRDAIGAALHFHVNSRSYLDAVTAPGAMRCGLDGSAVEAVTGERQAEATKLLAAISEAKAKRAPAP